MISPSNVGLDDINKVIYAAIDNVERTYSRGDTPTDEEGEIQKCV